MPAYNAAKCLETAVESVFAQTYGNFELIIVDDGSTDTTLDEANKLAAKDERIKVLQRENGGISAARNTGMEKATGDVIYFMDSDDTIVPHTAEIIVSAFEEYDADIVEFGIRFLDEEGNIKGESSPKLPKILFAGDEVRNYILAETLATSPEKSVPNGLSVYSCAVAYSAEFLKKLDFKMVSEREYIYEDYYTHLQLFGKAERVAILPDVLYNYYQHANSVLQRYQPERFERIKKLYAAALALCDENGYCENVRKRTSWFFISNVNVAMYAMMKNVSSPSEQRKILQSVLDDEAFIGAVNVWKDANLPRSRKILFTAFRSRNAFILQQLYKYELKKLNSTK